MNKKRVLTSMLVWCCLIASGQVKPTPVFVSGQDGHASYRIPAIVSLPGGQLLAFAEGRVKDSDDFGDINIVMKRSSDHGKTWSALTQVADYDTMQAGNPAPVVDLTDPDFPGGRIFLFYNTGNNHEGQVRKGKGYREVWYITSTDGGGTWSVPVNITTQVHRPLQPAVNPAWNFPEDWRSYANTPGHAMQFSRGQYKGRIYVAANHSAGTPKKRFEDYQAHGYYTDDHGKTFHLGASLPMPGSNEATATELSHGKLMINTRNQRGDVKARLVGISADGGASWERTYTDPQLPDPVCEGSLLNIGWKKNKAILAFCNAADTTTRDNLTLRISYDEGRTWPGKYVIAASGKAIPSYAAYSDIVKIDEQHIGVLYEADNYTKIVFVPQSL
ncbi:sialidase family protein [Chitinophaga arvensicola]|uniref:exo-alpha-sialidase n=1 Tax=Chitinophaga arvensicola TaxID=29529 RepID=A0A1I0S4P2_9BACT|nr:sialidase family protein [Chitinophaga arvensicola]SEW49765.1 sialidase-1 [Chitinophaga arvensicola]